MIIEAARKLLSWIEELLPEEDAAIEAAPNYGLAGIHDQEDELNRQHGVLLARFYDNLVSLGMPGELIEELVRMRFSRMLFADQSSVYEYQDDEDL